MIGRTIAHYRIDAELGRGGMGVVYRATDTRLGRSVALKFLPEELASDASARDRLLQEARTASALNHPHICTIHEVGEAEGRSYIAMEHVEGRPLRALLAEGGLPADTATRYAAQIAAAMAHAHQHGIVHRDLKTSNIIITPDGRAKVLDFGLATQHAGELGEMTRSRQTLDAGPVAGTLPYLAPELLRGAVADQRSDLWAFGVILYEMVSGALPFAGKTGFEVSSAILQAVPGPLPANVPAGLRAVIQRCLTKEPGQRYQQAVEARAALEAVTSDSAAQVVPAGKARFGRLAAGGAGILLVVAMLLAMNVGGWRDRLLGKSPTPDRIRSLAILPLKSLNPQTGEEFLGTGISDTLITKVSQIADLTVRPSSAVRKYATADIDALEAARQLKVDSVLDGSVQRAGDRLRVNLNLLRVRDGSSLWSHTFNVPYADMFAMQDQVAQQVAAGLQVKLTATENARLAKSYTSNPQAFEYFVKGMYNFDKRSLAPDARRASLEASIVMFQKAIELDPQYALAHAQLAYAYAWMALFIEPEPAWMDKARQEMDVARALDPNLALLHVVRHEQLWSAYEGFQIEPAVRELRLALQLDPTVGHDQLGVLYSHMGLEEAAHRELRRALEIDPTSELTISRYVEGFDLSYRPDEAIAAAQQYGGLDGPSSYLRSSFLWKRQFDKAEQMEKAISLNNAQDPFALSLRVRRLALQGDFRSFEAQIPVIVQRGKNSRAYHHMTYNIACVYALQGKPQAAVQWLKTTVDFGMPNYVLFSRDPHLDAIRKDPAFVQFMNQLKPRWEAWRQEFDK